MATFSSYINSGFGLLGSEVDFLCRHAHRHRPRPRGRVLGDEFGRRRHGKVHQEGAVYRRLRPHPRPLRFLAAVIFDSFAGLGLPASGTSLTAADLMRPGFVAARASMRGLPFSTRSAS